MIRNENCAICRNFVPFSAEKSCNIHTERYCSEVIWGNIICPDWTPRIEAERRICVNCSHKTTDDKCPHHSNQFMAIITGGGGICHEFEVSDRVRDLERAINPEPPSGEPREITARDVSEDVCPGDRRSESIFSRFFRRFFNV